MTAFSLNKKEASLEVIHVRAEPAVFIYIKVDFQPGTAVVGLVRGIQGPHHRIILVEGDNQGIDFFALLEDFEIPIAHPRKIPGWLPWRWPTHRSPV
jgi:hypothetical protein